MSSKMASASKKRKIDSDNRQSSPVTLEKYPARTHLARTHLTSFASTYLREALFSAMNHIKSKNRSRLTNEHLVELLRITVISSRNPQYQKIVESKPTHHFSH